ncbi:MAG: hypothetical protein WEA36_03775 [Balneolaceae bacterium]
MTPISQWGLRLGLFWLFSGVTLAGLAESPWLSSYYVRPLWIHMLVLGWMTQWIFAISIWMFPRSKHGYRERENIRTWSLLVCWNIALVGRALFEVRIMETSSVLRQGSMTLSVLLFWIATVLYVTEIWPRVRVKKQRSKRDQRGVTT